MTGYDLQITMAVAAGNLELSQFLPLVADSLLTAIRLLTNACTVLRTGCVEGIVANEERCRLNTDTCTASATALVDVLGYELVQLIVKEFHSRGGTLRDAAVRLGLLSADAFDQLVSPEAVMKLGSTKKRSI